MHIRVEEVLIQGHPHPSTAGGLKHCAWAEGRAQEEEQMGKGGRKSIKLMDVILCSLEHCKLEHIPTFAQGTTGISRVAHFLQSWNGNGSRGKEQNDCASPVWLSLWESFKALCTNTPGPKSSSPYASFYRQINPFPSTRWVEEQISQSSKS